MEAVLVSAKKKSDLTILVSLAKKLGMSAKALSQTEIEDWKFAQKIEVARILHSRMDLKNRIQE